MSKPWLVAIGAAALIASASCDGRAEGGNEAQLCNGEVSGSTDEQIEACTTLISSGRYDEATLAVIYGNRGQLWMDKADYYKAVSDFSDAISLNPRDAQTFCNRGVAKRQVGDERGAAEDIEKAKQLDASICTTVASKQDDSQTADSTPPPDGNATNRPPSRRVARERQADLTPPASGGDPGPAPGPAAFGPGPASAPGPDASPPPGPDANAFDPNAQPPGPDPGLGQAIQDLAGQIADLAAQLAQTVPAALAQAQQIAAQAQGLAQQALQAAANAQQQAQQLAGLANQLAQQAAARGAPNLQQQAQRIAQRANATQVAAARKADTSQATKGAAAKSATAQATAVKPAQGGEKNPQLASLNKKTTPIKPSDGKGGHNDPAKGMTTNNPAENKTATNKLADPKSAHKDPGKDATTSHPATNNAAASKASDPKGVPNDPGKGGGIKRSSANNAENPPSHGKRTDSRGGSGGTSGPVAASSTQTHAPQASGAQQLHPSSSSSSDQTHGQQTTITRRQPTGLLSQTNNRNSYSANKQANLNQPAHNYGRSGSSDLTSTKATQRRAQPKGPGYRAPSTRSKATSQSRSSTKTSFRSRTTSTRTQQVSRRTYHSAASNRSNYTRSTRATSRTTYRPVSRSNYRAAPARQAYRPAARSSGRVAGGSRRR